MEKFLPTGELLRSDGMSDYDIIKSFNDFVRSESIKLYRKNKNPKPIKKAISKVLSEKEDSKIEVIYFDLLNDAKIPFEFQYKIGKFKADFLIDGWLVFEIDGPDHDKNKDDFRDKYMKKLGYEILRVSAWMASASPDAVIDEIKDLYNNGTSKP